VTYTGVTPSQPVRLYRSAAVTGTGLDQYLDLTIEVGTGGGFGTCTGFTPTGTISTGTLQAFMTARTDFSTGLSTTWTPSGSPQTRVFRFTLSVQDTNAAQAKNANFGFTWEAQN
jgi:hypothetical protein